MRLASLASLRSNCMKRRVGCVLVRERRVVATGYNGTPRGVRNCNEGGCGRCNGEGDGLGQGGGEVRQGMGVGLEECLCLHAEENALLEGAFVASRREASPRRGGVLTCLFPFLSFFFPLCSGERQGQWRWDPRRRALLQHVSPVSLSPSLPALFHPIHPR